MATVIPGRDKGLSSSWFCDSSNEKKSRFTCELLKDKDRLFLQYPPHHSALSWILETNADYNSILSTANIKRDIQM